MSSKTTARVRVPVYVELRRDSDRTRQAAARFSKRRIIYSSDDDDDAPTVQHVAKKTRTELPKVNDSTVRRAAKGSKENAIMVNSDSEVEEIAPPKVSRRVAVLVYSCQAFVLAAQQ